MRVVSKSLIGLSFIASLILSGCGGNGSSSSSTTETTDSVMTGVFSDAPVDGLKYMSATQSGYTQNGGQFLYQNGEMVQFYLGDVLLGECLGQEMVTPINIVDGAVDTTNTRVQNILRLLQTCDGDGNPENGIMLGENAKMLHFSNPVNLDSEAGVQSIISEVNSSLVLVDTTTAVGHFQNQQGMMMGDQNQTQAQIHTPPSMPTPMLGASDTTVNSQVTDSVEQTSTSTTSSDTTATLKFDRATGELTNLGNTEVTITNLIVDFSGSYTYMGMTIPFSGTYNYEEGTIVSTTSGVSTTVPMTDEMKKLYPMTVKAGEVIPSGASEYNVPVSGATGQINYTYTFVTTSGNFVEHATITIG